MIGNPMSCRGAIAHLALDSTRKLLWNTLNQQPIDWLSITDDQFVLITPHAVAKHDDPCLESACATAFDLVGNIYQTSFFQYLVHVINNETCSITLSNAVVAAPVEAPQPDRSLYCTLIWTQHGDKTLLSHCQTHIEQARQKPEGYRSIVTAPQEEELPARLPLRTSDGETYWIERKDIVYVKANQTYSEVHTTSRTLRLHVLFKDVINQLSPTVVRINRSYAVNPTYVDSLRGDTLHLTTAEKLPVPPRRIKETRNLLTQEMGRF